MTTTALAHVGHPVPPKSLAVKVVTPRNSTLEMAALEAAMRGLVLDEKHPVALELAGTAAEQMWIIRATTPEALNHACRQLRARYPQIEFLPLAPEEDPFRLVKKRIAKETVSVVKLAPGADRFVPLQPWDEKTLDKEGTDPLLGVFAAIQNLPGDLRAVAQLAIVPAPVNWAGPIGARRAVEHPLEPEREQKRAALYAERGGGFSWITMIGFVVILAGLYLWPLLHLSIPPWELAAGTSLLHGQLPPLSIQRAFQFYGEIALLFTGILLLYVLYDQLRKRIKGGLTRHLVDPRVVSQKTEQAACRVRLRLYVIGPGPRLPLAAYLRRKVPQLLSAGLRSVAKALREAYHRLARQSQDAVAQVAKLRHPVVAAKAVSRTLKVELTVTAKAVSRALVWEGRCLWGGLRHPVQCWRAVYAHLLCSIDLLFTSMDEHGFIRRAYKVGAMVQRELAGRHVQARRRNAVILRMVAAYRQFHRGSGGYFVPRPVRTRASHRLISPRRGWRYRRHGWEVGVRRSQHYLSMKELSGAWHLHQALDLPHAALVAVRAARSLPIAPDVARMAQGDPVIGRAKHGEHDIPFAFTREWLRLHALLLGKSGEGKSSTLLHIAQAAMQEGGMVFFDLPGDNIPHVLRLVPPKREKDVVVIDLSDPVYSVGLNPLDVTMGRGRDKTIADLLETLSHIWMRSWGSRMENAFEFALRTAWEANQYQCDVDKQGGPTRQFTLLDILPLYTNASFCHSLLQYSDDPYVRRWWTEYYDPLPLYMKRDIVNPVATKVAKFESEIARRIVGQPVSKINLTEIIREKKILLIRLAKGTIGADAAPLLGATLLGLLSVCLEEQGALDEQERALFPILIDEFQALEGVDWSMLAQLRKYGATFFLATQSLEYLKQLDALLLPTVLANIRQIYCFNLSAQDAWTIHRELGVEPEDIINLDSYMCYVKLKSGVQRRPTFSLQIEQPPVGDVALAEAIRRDSQQKYATPAATVDPWLRKAVARQGVGGEPSSVIIDADDDVVIDPVVRQLPADQPGQLQGTQAPKHAPRVRGQGGKGESSQRNDQKDRKPQVAATPTGVPRSTPALFATRSGTDDVQEKEE